MENSQKNDLDLLLVEAKKHLGIEFGDRDHSLSLHLKASFQYFKNICGVDIDFSKNDYYKEMLFERVRYADASALSLYEENFGNDLTRMALEVAMEDARKKSNQEKITKGI